MEKVKVIRETAKGIKFAQVIEIEKEIEDDRKIMSRRTIKEYWTLDHKFIGKIDPLDDYPLIEPFTKW